MFLASTFIVAIAKVISVALEIYMWIIIVRAFISWVNPDPYNPIVRFLISATEPVLYFIRRRLPFSMGGIDFSPIIAILAIYFLQLFLVNGLVQIAERIG